MAREMALAGVDPSELAPPPPPKEPKTFREKCSNFWYHYKPFVIIGAFLLVVGGWLLVQTLTKDTPDYHVVAVTELPLYNEELDGMEGYLAAHGEDIDGDGKIEVEVENLTPSFYDEMAPNVGHADMQKLMSYLSTGERMMFVFDQVSFEGFSETVASVTSEGYTFFAPLHTSSDNYDENEHYWNWIGDERVAEYGLSELPENVYFGVRSPEGMADRDKSHTLYEQGLILIENLAAQ